MGKQHLLLLQGVFVLQWYYLLLCSISATTVKSSPLGAQSNRSCGSGYYYDMDTSSGASCHECSVCSPGEGVLLLCTDTSNTVCTQCDILSTFDAATGTWECVNCTNCTWEHRQEAVACNGSDNSVCGGCLKGYYLGVDRSGLTLCMRCSRCPPDRRVIRWRDCKAAGLDRSMWCSPGYVAATEQLQNTEPARSHSVAAMPTTYSTANSTIDEPFVGDNHFLSLPDDGVGVDGGSEKSFVLVISAASCLFLALLLCLLMGGLLFRLKCLRSNSSGYQTVTMDNHAKADGV